MHRLLAAATLALVLAMPVRAQVGGTVDSSSIVITPSSAFALLGCDVFDTGGPSVAFLQLPLGFTFGIVGSGDGFVGESCADTLSLLLRSGFSLVESRTVQQSSSREAIVYDLFLP